MIAPAIIVDITPESAALLAAARHWPANLTKNLIATLDEENELTVGHIAAARMHGTGPFPPSEGRLGVVSSRLVKSVRRASAAIHGAAIDSEIGSNVRYAGAHEYGFKGTVQVKQHTAHNPWLDQLSIGGRTYARWESFGVRGRSKAKKVASGAVTIRAHAMQMNIPARAPIRRGIEDRLGDYRSALSVTIVDTFSAS